jgi:hypothetical protein
MPPPLTTKAPYKPAPAKAGVNFPRTVCTTFHCRGTTSNVSVMSSPSLASLPPQHGQTVGAGITTRSRGRCSGKGARTGFVRVKLVMMVGSSADFALTASSVALASSSSSWSSSLAPRSADGPKRSRRNLAMTSLRCATMASAPVARASASWRAWRSATSALFQCLDPVEENVGCDRHEPDSTKTKRSRTKIIRLNTGSWHIADMSR